MSWAWVLLASYFFIDISSFWLFQLYLVSNSYYYLIIYIIIYYIMCTPIFADADLIYFFAFVMIFLKINQNTENKVHNVVFVSLSVVICLSTTQINGIHKQCISVFIFFLLFNCAFPNWISPKANYLFCLCYRVVVC